MRNLFSLSLIVWYSMTVRVENSSCLGQSTDHDTWGPSSNSHQDGVMMNATYQTLQQAMRKAQCGDKEAYENVLILAFIGD